MNPNNQIEDGVIRKPDQTYFFENDGRVLVWYSDGAASAVAAKFAVGKYAGSSRELHVIKCDTTSDENQDNLRFRRDVEKWIGWPIELIRSTEYANVDDVIERTRYMSGPEGARCTTELKKIPRRIFQRPTDIHIFGLTSDEADRIKDFEFNNPELFLEWNLRDANFSKEQCLNAIRVEGISLPIKYKQGFQNNNCDGCLKATSPHYWNHVRKFTPEVFKKRCEQSRKLGVRLVRLKGIRIFLDELPPDSNEIVKEDLSCGPHCGTLPQASDAMLAARKGGV